MVRLRREQRREQQEVLKRAFRNSNTVLSTERAKEQRLPLPWRHRFDKGNATCKVQTMARVNFKFTTVTVWPTWKHVSTGDLRLRWVKNIGKSGKLLLRQVLPPFMLVSTVTNVFSMPISTDTTWPVGLVCRTELPPLENRYLGPYNKLITYYFGPTSFEFFVAPQCHLFRRLRCTPSSCAYCGHQGWYLGPSSWSTLQSRCSNASAVRLYTCWLPSCPSVMDWACLELLFAFTVAMLSPANLNLLLKALAILSPAISLRGLGTSTFFLSKGSPRWRKLLEILLAVLGCWTKHNCLSSYSVHGGTPVSGNSNFSMLLSIHNSTVHHVIITVAVSSVQCTIMQDQNTVSLNRLQHWFSASSETRDFSWFGY